MLPPPLEKPGGSKVLWRSKVVGGDDFAERMDPADTSLRWEEEDTATPYDGGGWFCWFCCGGGILDVQRERVGGEGGGGCI